MGFPLRHFARAVALTMFGLAAPAAFGASFHAIGAPPGFRELASEREVLVDVYSGGRKVAEARALAKPGTLRFRAPRELLGKLPDVVPGIELETSLAGELATNSKSACSLSKNKDCGALDPEVLAIIYDEDHFRVDLFINRRFFRISRTTRSGFLPAPTAPLSITNAFGMAATGTLNGPSTVNVQNRTIVALRNARLSANTSLASRAGFVVDDLVGETEHDHLRYSAGLFWTPGNDFTGRRRIAGVGVATQFDTRADRDSLYSTPLIVFLAEPARVELIVDKRLAGSRSYPAGNVEVDTSGLGDGSYAVLLRIHGAGGRMREERRFFVKNRQIAPLGRPVLYAYAGMLANSRRGRAVGLSDEYYYHAGGAWRPARSLAFDLSVLGTKRKAILETGGWLIGGPVRLRAAGLVSSAGDTGALLRLASSGQGPLTFNFDLRRIRSKDGRPLVPSSSFAETFDGEPLTGVQLAEGSYTQAIASFGLRLGAGFLSVVGTYRKDRNLKADYSVGPNLNWPLVTHNKVQFVLEASAQHTRMSTAGLVTVRASFVGKRTSIVGRLGHEYEDERGSGVGPRTRVVGSLSAQYSHETAARTLINAEAGFDRDISSSSLHARGLAEGRFGALRADVLHGLEGKGRSQYDLAYQSAFAIGAGAAAWGGRDLDRSTIVVGLEGGAADAAFDVLVDGVARGRIRAGKRLSLFVPAYRTYSVRLVPTLDAKVDYDTAAREVTLYPGNVGSLLWRAYAVSTIFAQAIDPRGAGIANALVQGPKSVGETDANGFFQIDVRDGAPLTVRKPDGGQCRIALAKVPANSDFASLGKVVCR